MQRYTVYLYLKTALHVSGGTSTHHQERIQLYLQHLVFVTPLLLSAAIVKELEPVWVCCGWLWWPCRPGRGLNQSGARVRACRCYTDWRGQGRSTHPEPTRPACLDEIKWPSGRTLRMSDPGGMMRMCGLCKTVNLGTLACRGGHRSRRYRRLWPRRGNCSVSLFSPKFLNILSTKRASCKDMLCLGLNPNCLSCISPRSPTSCNTRKKNYELVLKAKIELHLFQQYFTPHTPPLKQSESETNLSPDLPSTNIIRSKIPFRKCFKLCSPVSDLVTRYGPQATTRFTMPSFSPIQTRTL